MRRERIVFEEIYKKLETELHTKTEKCKEIVKIAQNANNDWDKATKELSELIKEAESEKKQFDDNMKDLNMKILEERAKKEVLKGKE